VLHSNPRSVVAHLAVASAVAFVACGEHAADRDAADGGSLSSSCGNEAATCTGAGDAGSPSHDGGGAGAPSHDAGNAGEAGSGQASCAKWLATASNSGTSAWVHVDATGHLAYETMPRGDRIMDFSHAGYMGGGVALPVLPARKTVSPAGGTADDTATIQAALDAVAALPLSAGLRGAVVLAPGAFNIRATLTINTSGVVLRGSGSGTGGTSLVMTGATPFLAITMSGSGSYETAGSAATIIDSYVPSGATSFNVKDASGLAVGDAVLIHRPVTTAWLALMGMDHLVSSAGQPETWLGAGSTIDTDRTIASISGNTITLDAPLTDSFDAAYLSPPGASVEKYTFAGRLSQVGVEHLRVIGPALDVPIADPQYSMLQMNDVIDAWVSDVAVQDTQNAFAIGSHARRVTLDRATVTHTIAHTGDNMADFSLSGTQTLVSRSSSTGTGEWPIVTQGRETGPIVALGFTSNQPSGISPHQRWATGLLADSCAFPNSPKGTPGVAFWDRGTHGSGQGWTVGWAVAWNVSSPFLLMQQPPGSQNWCIGCTGQIVTKAPAGSSTTPPNGIFDSPGAPVTPGSLYLAQLCERLGPKAVANIGY
jgi:hypothetical protein